MHSSARGFTLRRLLRQSRRSCEGFTLIELMVVMAIIAILATVSFIAYGNTQTVARDSRRVQDIQSIATAMEGHFLTFTGTCMNYSGTTTAGNPQTYCPPYQSWFSQGKIPTDPKHDSSNNNAYCLGTTTVTGVTVNDPASGWGGAACGNSTNFPTQSNVTWTNISNSAGLLQSVVAQSNIYNWKVCAYMENPNQAPNGKSFYCMSSTQQ